MWGYPPYTHMQKWVFISLELCGSSDRMFNVCFSFSFMKENFSALPCVCVWGSCCFPNNTTSFLVARGIFFFFSSIIIEQTVFSVFPFFYVE